MNDSEKCSPEELKARIDRAYEAKDVYLHRFREMFTEMHRDGIIENDGFRQLMSYASDLDATCSDAIWALGTLVKYPPDFG